MSYETEREAARVEHPFHGVRVEYFLQYNMASRADADRAELRAWAGLGCYTTLSFEKDPEFGWSKLDNAISFAQRCWEFGREAYREELVKFLGINVRR